MEAREPAELAALLERSTPLPPGEEERLVGYGVMAAPFSSGHLLAMRRYTGSSFGPAYTSVWHRSPEGAWTIYTDWHPRESCPRYFGAALERAVETPIALAWPGPRRLTVAIPLAALSWTVDLTQTGTSRFLNAVGRTMTDRMWRSPRVLETMSRVAATLLRSGRLGLAGRLPNGQSFVANPMTLWLIDASHATLGGRDLGQLAPLPEQTRLADFWIPQRALFAFGRSFFEPFDATRHLAVVRTRPEASRPAEQSSAG